MLRMKISPPPHGAGLDDQLGGFRNRHEKTGHIGMGNRYGATIGDLSLEKGNDTAHTAGNVAEAYGHEACGIVRAAVDGLNDHLGNALGYAHDIRGSNGFVGGDENESFNAHFTGGSGHVERSVDIVFDRFPGLDFQHGNMLVGGGMEHCSGAMLLEYGLHLVDLNDVCEYRTDVDRFPGLFQLQLDIVEAAFGLVEKDQLTGANRQTWRHSSDPMDPPAPVISTVCPLM
jgi:hypothetical protein